MAVERSLGLPHRSAALCCRSVSVVQQQRLPGTFRKRVRKGKTTYQARLQLRGQPEQCVSLGTDLQAALRRFADIQRQCLDLNPAMGEPASVAAVAHLWLERSTSRDLSSPAPSVACWPSSTRGSRMGSSAFAVF